MRVVIAGSSGLIGSHLVSALRDAGHQVGRLVRRPARDNDEFQWDPHAGILPAEALRGADVLVNLCGASVGGKRWSDARKQVLRDSRIVPSEVLAAAAVSHEIPVLINGSAIGYYGDTGDHIVTESAAPGTDFLAKLCQDWEAATAPAEQAGIRVVRSRTGIVISSSGGMIGMIKPLFSLFLGGRVGAGTQYLSWISLADHIAVLIFAITNSDLRGPINSVAPNPVTNAEFTTLLGKALRRPTPWVAPSFALKAVLGEMAGSVLTGQRATPARLAELGFEFQYEKLEDALAATIG